LENASKKCRKW